MSNSNNNLAKTWLRAHWPLALLSALVAFSILLQLGSLYALSRARLAVQEQLAGLRAEVTRLQGDTIDFDLDVQQQIPIQVDIPVQQNLTIPISTTVILDNDINLPLDTPFGNTIVPIPVQAEVPIRADVPISINETVAISTVVDLDLTVPIRIPISETPLAAYLEQLQKALAALQERL